MKIVFSSRAWAEYADWQSADRKVAEKMNEIIADTMRHPFAGLGKPEPLRNELAGWWSRRITQEDRLVYRVSGKGDEQSLEIAACRFHYKL